jgi:hypothetical protein
MTDSDQRRQEIKRLGGLFNEIDRNIFGKVQSTPISNTELNNKIDKMPDKLLHFVLLHCRLSYYNLFKIIKND